MALPRARKSTGCLAAIIFVIVGCFTGESGYFIAALFWGGIGYLMGDDD